MEGPDYRGRGLVNLVAELERRLTGRSAGAGLEPALASRLPEGPSYVLMVFDGLGTAQLEHPAVRSLRDSAAATLHAPFPSTTSVSLATLATGIPPSRSGMVGHLVWLPETGRVVNTLKWVDLRGAPVVHDYASVLPPGNLWERMRAAGVEPVTVQPGSFQGSPLSRLLYRGARFEPVWAETEMVEATCQLAAEPRRLVVTYFWEVDFAGHVSGLDSAQFDQAMATAGRIWDRVRAGLPRDAVLVGTSDHGLIEYGEEDKLLVREERFRDLRFAGDPRGIQIWGPAEEAEALAELTGGVLVDPLALLGPEPSPLAKERVGDHLLLAPEGKVVLPPGFDKRLRCYHGGIAPEERDIPLLVG